MDGNQSIPMEVATASKLSVSPAGNEIPRLADDLENRCTALEEVVQLLQGKLARVTRDPSQDAAPALANPPSITGLGVDLCRSADRLAVILRELHDLYERIEL